jgi:hypothetical protein
VRPGRRSAPSAAKLTRTRTTGEFVLAEGVGEFRGLADHVRGAVRLAGEDGDTVLQVDDDKGGLRVEGGDGHG